MSDEPLREPAPAGVQVDRDLIAARLGATIETDAPELVPFLFRGELGWRLDPWDSEGWASVRVFWADSGEALDDVGAQCHWSSVVRPAG